MILIIAEKPSLARNIVAGIGQMKKNNGYFEGLGYIVTWAFGHLFSLCDIEDYTGDTASGRWSMENIPCFPENFRFKLKSGENKKPDAGVMRQFEIIKTLCNRSDVEAIVNAGDADREGEIIVRLCVQNALSSEKPLLRLWLPDQTPETVAEALKTMKSESEYDLLANEGFARTYIDWLYGVNLTRYASLRTGVLLRVGRVIVPVVKAIYDRDMAIRNFVPDKYWALVSTAETNGETVELISKHKFPKEKAALAQRACDKLNAQDAIVTAKKTKKDKLNPGKLYSLSKLQNFLGKKYKMPMDTSLRIVQKLYEEGFLTYPRTNSEYLATAEKDKIKKIIEIVKGKGYPVEFKDKKTIFDDSKIESHSALTPTYKFPQPGQLSEEEKTVYSAVLRRFVAVFCSEECVVQKTEITVSVGECEDYFLKGLMILEPGWTKYDEAGKNNKILPNLEKGDRVNTDFKPKEKETSPPKHYTIETLNNYLKNPFREDKAAADDSDDAEDYKAIFEGLELGTEATRTGIIDNAVKSKYIELKKDVYKILPDGEYLIEQLSNMGISMDKYKTSELGQALKRVFHGEITIDDSVLQAVNEIKGVFNAPENSPESEFYFGFAGDETGICPVCGEKVTRGKYGYGCTGYKEGCKFRIPGALCKRVITPTHAKQLLTEGKTQKIEGFISKTGKPFSAKLVMKENKAVFLFED
ncbi:MAG: topoisomerase C-terminal repeat-containing protein [Clostridia bacterium]|nr:topoisomerase C-terminal repeat-containing protein [Clostridia bacterium]